MAECKGCGTTLLEDEPVHMVAQWSFCGSCFEKLLQKNPEPEPLPEDAPQVPPVTGPHCSLCEAPIAGAGNKVGIWLFCDRCVADLVGPAGPEPVEPEASEPDPEPEPVWTGPDPRTPVSCSGCGRQIPLGGARELERQYYCPECFIGLSSRTPPVVAAQTGESCESCDRRLPLDRLRSMDGFMICSACLAVDPDLALSNARTRHRARMEAAGSGARK